MITPVYTYIYCRTSHSKTWALIWSWPPAHSGYHSLHSSGKSFHKILEWNLQPFGHLWGQALMLDERAWLAIVIPIHPKGVQWGCSQGSVQITGVAPRQTHQTMSLCTLWVTVLLEQERVFTQTVDTKLEAFNCVKCLCSL